MLVIGELKAFVIPNHRIRNEEIKTRKSNKATYSTDFVSNERSMSAEVRRCEITKYLEPSINVDQRDVIGLFLVDNYLIHRRL